MTPARLGVKVKVIGQGQGSDYCYKYALTDGRNILSRYQLRTSAAMRAAEADGSGRVQRVWSW